MTKTEFLSLSNANYESKKYSIGEFASINKISARMLRHYDKIGLFQPRDILENGYRCYSSEQISTISLIKKYQVCGFTLSEISKLLCANEETIALLAKEKRLQLEEQGTKQAEAINQLLILSGEHSSPLPNEYAISYTQQSERLILCGATPICENEIDDAFEALYSTIELNQIQPTGLPLLLSGLDDENTPYYIAVSVSQKITSDKFICKILPSGWYLSTLHHGGYDSIGVAYDRLLCHAQAHNYQLVTPFIERYFLDCTHAATFAEYITEISIKITS